MRMGRLPILQSIARSPSISLVDKSIGVSVIQRAVIGACLFYATQCIALPFTIVPTPGTTLPTLINPGQTITALYTVTNNTAGVRAHNYVKYLPPNVTQVTQDVAYPDLCGASFDLAPGASCQLELQISGAVNGLDPNPHHHLFVCLPGGATCAGTPYALHVLAGPWSNTFFNASPGFMHQQSAPLHVPALDDVSLYAIATIGTNVYVGGADGANRGALWALRNGTWTTQYTVSTNSSVIEGIASANNDLLYFVVHDATTGWVYRFIPSNGIGTDLGLSGAKQLHTTVFDNGILYVGGTDTSDVGQVWSYASGAFTALNPPSLGIIHAMTVTPTDHVLYITGVDASHQAHVLSYLGGVWTDTSLPTTILSVDALVSAPDGAVYAGGYDVNYQAVVMRYQQHQWTTLAAPDGEYVNGLVLSNDGTLFATGVDNQFHAQVWSYRGGTWTTTQLVRAGLVEGLALDSTGQLYAAGVDLQNHDYVWSYRNRS